MHGMLEGFAMYMFRQLSVVTVLQKRFWRELAETLPTLIDFVATSDESAARHFITLVLDFFAVAVR